MNLCIQYPTLGKCMLGRARTWEDRLNTTLGFDPMDESSSQRHKDLVNQGRTNFIGSYRRFGHPTCRALDTRSRMNQIELLRSQFLLHRVQLDHHRFSAQDAGLAK
jgi:hypothetical protein